MHRFAAATSANPSGGLTFTKTNFKANSGSVTLVMTNPSSSGIAHGIGIQGNGVDKDGQIVSPGSKSTDPFCASPYASLTVAHGYGGDARVV